MRLYKNLEDRSIDELKILLNAVKTHSELTYEEKSANIANIESILRIHSPREDILEDIKSGMADIDDLMN